MKESNMPQVETTIDSVRVTPTSQERTIILKQKGAERYVPIWVSSSQADILTAQLQGRPEESTSADLFLASIIAAESDIKSVTIHLEDNTFHSKLLLLLHDEPGEVSCPIGIALALAFRTGVSILVDQSIIGEAGVTLPPCLMLPAPKRPWWKKSYSEFLPDSPEDIAHSMDAQGLRGKIDRAFQNAVARVRGG
jgi:bifunctional DNase/RNase